MRSGISARSAFVVAPAIVALAVLVRAQGPEAPQKLVIEGKVFDGNRTTPFDLTEAHSGSTFRGCTFRNMPEAAIRISGASDLLIENCRFENIRSGVPGKDTHAIVCGARGRRITIRSCKFVDIGADGIQMGHGGIDIGDIQILDSEFRVRGEDVGENGVDLKRVQGPVRVSGNVFHGFRPCDGETQDATGSAGEAMVVHMGAANVTIERNRFYDNTIGVRVRSGAAKNPKAKPPVGIVVRNNWFYDNLDGGVQVANVHSIQILNNTFLNNGAHLNTELRIDGAPPAERGVCRNVNNLFAGKGGGNDAWGAKNNAVYGSAAAAGFVNRAARDLHLRPDSPAVDRGAAVDDLKSDIDGEARPGGLGFDIGADELWPAPSRGFTGNGPRR